MKGSIPVDATKVYATKYFSLYQKETQQFDGSYKTFERVRTYDIAKSLCVVDDKILVIETHMPGDLHFHSIPWGMIDDGESPSEAVQRETLEETWIEFEHYEELCVLRSNIWLVESYKYYYLARDPKSFGAQSLDEWGEKITLYYLSYDEFVEAIKNDEIFRDLGTRILRTYILPWKEDELKKLLFWS